MKPEEARAIANAVVLKKTIMPKYYKLIKEAAEKGIYFVNIGKAGVDVVDLLKEEGQDK